MLYQQLEKHLNKSNFLRKVVDDYASERQGLLYYQLNLTTKTLIASTIFEHIKTQKSGHKLLVVTQDDNVAEEFVEEFSLLLGKESAIFIPDFETLPYEERSPHSSIRAKRLEGLTRLIKPDNSIVVVSIKNLMRIIIPPQILSNNILTIKVDDEHDLDQLCSKLVSIGYNNESEIVRVGDFARRGGILDIFSPTAKQPVRLDFFGDTITSIRYFDPLTQRSTQEVIEPIQVIPVREVLLDDITTSDNRLWSKIHSSGLYDGIEQDVALLYEQNSTLIDYLPSNNKTIIFDEYHYLEESAEEIFEDATELYLKYNSERKKESAKPLPSIDNLFLDFDRLSALLRRERHLFLSVSQFQHKHIKDSIISPFSSQLPINGDLSLLRETFNQKLQENWQIIVQSDNQSQSQRMRALLVDFEDKINFKIGVLQRGFNLEDAQLSLFTDHEIFNRYKQRKYQEYYATGESIIDYNALTPGDYIVHVDHGIGIYEGLKLMPINGGNIECLSIRYADEGRVYVPTFQLRLVTRFIADEGITPELNKIGSKKWENTKKRAKKQIELIADDLVKLYAERSARNGIQFENDNIWQTELEESFIYEDTPDQKRATEEIKRDMEKTTPMERLLCGDVGFGKTEVAIRAAFKAVVSGWQVCVLVPTTLLAEQHYTVFKERLAQYPVQIALFSRFRQPAQIRNDVLRLSTGEIDIAIGTHRLLSKDIRFKKIGLLIIDEEHRFGVRHKETIRKIKSNVDTLYMSATPIPRTLSMALSKFKEMSLMQTSPKARLPIRTLIIGYDRQIIKEAIQRELDRGGQVIFVHNRVETIDSIAAELRELLPKIRVAVGHGQLPERQLEKIMIDFYAKDYDLLVATTIIESGIDIPNANTIIINRADMFGLAQLYQIRGRVGRSNRRAYAYFIIPKHLNPQARKRLEALTEYNSLGAGYQIAMRDLELRGAGSLLGTKQSGVIQTIGFNYYNRLLSEAITSLLDTPGEIKWKDDEQDKQSVLRVEADFFFPDSYIRDERTKLSIYQRMLDFTEIEQFDELENELLDRFGKLPDPASRGIRFYRLKLMVDTLSIQNFQINKTKVSFSFPLDNTPSKDMLEKLVTVSEYPIQFDATSNYLRATISLKDNTDPENALFLAESIIDALSP
ncbi:MAG: transcription-repair coupling factor [Candidatus Cloacimonetes bacterium]|nr:transcription-repair coupling factor [Candidatus Cloacimonadota bacterium]